MNRTGLRACRSTSRSPARPSRVLLAKDASGGARQHGRRRSRRRSRSRSEGLIDRAHAYRTNAGTGIVQPTAAPVALTDFLDQKRAGAPAGEVPRGPYTIRALRIGKHRDGTQAGRAHPGAGPRPRVGAGHDHARDRRAARAQLRDRPGDEADRRQHRHLPDPVEQPRRGELQLLQLRLPAAEHDEPLPGRRTPIRAGGTPGAST